MATLSEPTIPQRSCYDDRSQGSPLKFHKSLKEVKSARAPAKEQIAAADRSKAHPSSHSTALERLATVPECEVSVFRDSDLRISDSSSSQKQARSPFFRAKRKSTNEENGSVVRSGDAAPGHISETIRKPPVPDCITTNREVGLTKSELLSNIRLLEAPLLKLVQDAIRPFSPEKDFEPISKAVVHMMLHVDQAETCDSLVDLIARRLPILSRISAHWQGMAKYTDYFKSMRQLNKRIKKHLEASLQAPEGISASSEMLKESLESAVASRAGVADSHMLSATVSLGQIVTALAGNVNASVVPQHLASVISQDQGPSQLRVMHSALDRALQDLYPAIHVDTSKPLDILSPAVFYTLASHACNLILCPHVNIREPSTLSDYVRTSTYNHSPTLTRSILSTVIRPRVRRLVEHMHSSHAFDASAGGRKDSASQQVDQEHSKLVDGVCALLCDHAYSTDSVLALRAACAEDLPHVTKAAVQYIIQLKEAAAAQEAARKLSSTSAKTATDAHGKSKERKALSWRSGNIITKSGNSNSSNSREAPLTADSKPWRPQGQGKHSTSSHHYQAPRLPPTAAGLQKPPAECFTPSPEPPVGFHPATMHAANAHMRGTPQMLPQVPMHAGTVPSMPMHMVPQVMMPPPYMCPPDDMMPRDPYIGQYPHASAPHANFPNRAQYSTPPLGTHHLETSEETTGESSGGTLIEQTPACTTNPAASTAVPDTNNSGEATDNDAVRKSESSPSKPGPGNTTPEGCVYYVPMWAAGPGMCYPTGPPILAPPPDQNPELPPLPTPTAQGPPMAFPAAFPTPPGAPISMHTPAGVPFAPPTPSMQTMHMPMHMPMHSAPAYMHTPGGPLPEGVQSDGMHMQQHASGPMMMPQQACMMPQSMPHPTHSSAPRNQKPESPARQQDKISQHKESGVSPDSDTPAPTTAATAGSTVYTAKDSDPPLGSNCSDTSASPSAGAVTPVLDASQHASESTAQKHVQPVAGSAPQSTSCMYPMHMQDMSMNYTMPMPAPMSHPTPVGNMYGSGYGMNAPMPYDMHGMHAMMPVTEMPDASMPINHAMSPACMPTMMPAHMHPMNGMMQPQMEGSGMPPYPMYTPTVQGDAMDQSNGLEGSGSMFGSNSSHPASHRRSGGNGGSGSYRRSAPSSYTADSGSAASGGSRNPRRYHTFNTPSSHKSRRSKELQYGRSHDEGSWCNGPSHMKSQGMSPPKPASGNINSGNNDAQQSANYVAVDESRGTFQQLPENTNRSPCNHFVKHGWCPMAKICKHAHEGGRSVKANLQGYPIRPGKQVCAEYMMKASCKLEMRCPLNHPNITPAQSAAASEPTDPSVSSSCGAQNGSAHDVSKAGASNTSALASTAARAEM